MGCVSSKPDINEQHPNIFQVTNVNEQRELLSPGQLEVTETELVLHQKNKDMTVWPLRALRKYGFDSEIFSFECGRRCPTGEGVYAFHCRKAEQLFNIVQHNIVRNSSNEEGAATAAGDFPVPVASSGPPVQRRGPDGFLTGVRSHPSLSRPGSVTSNGPVSPVTPNGFGVEVAGLEHNNNKRASLPDHSYCNSVIAEAEAEASTVHTNYANLGSPISPISNNLDSPSRLYMNIATNEAGEHAPETNENPNTLHCYANIDTKELEHLRPLLKTNFEASSAPQTPTSLTITVTEVNYTELDFDPAVVQPKPAPESPKAKKSYATIDFQRTNALSQSINPPIEVEDGSRKTRHNSTISDIPTRHSNSLSE